MNTTAKDATLSRRSDVKWQSVLVIALAAPVVAVVGDLLVFGTSPCVVETFACLLLLGFCLIIAGHAQAMSRKKEIGTS